MVVLARGLRRRVTVPSDRRGDPSRLARRMAGLAAKRLESGTIMTVMRYGRPEPGHPDRNRIR